MIDIAFSKLAIIGVAALVFIGPEKLPKVARMAGTLFGRAQRYINDVKSEVSREMELDELRKMHKDVQDAAGDVERSVTQGISVANSGLNSAWDDSGADDNPLMEPPTYDQSSDKTKNFRKKKLAATSSVPSWYKRQSGQKSRVISGAARMAKFRPPSARKSTPFFH